MRVMTKSVRLLALALFLGPVTVLAQQKTPFHNLWEALQAGGSLSGRNGPANVNWIDGGRRFSFTATSASNFLATAS